DRARHPATGIAPAPPARCDRAEVTYDGAPCWNHAALEIVGCATGASEDYESLDRSGRISEHGDSRMRQPGGRSSEAGRPASGLATSTSSRPPAQPGTVSRPSLIERLAQADSPPIVSVVAPSGFGKTTLLSQWAEHDGQVFA